MFNQKKIFRTILIGFVFILILLPFLVTFNDLLTRFVQGNMLYLFIERYIVPVEAKMMGTLMIILGYSFSFSPSNSVIVVNGLPIQISWNCLGWQSMLLLLITFFVGLREKYKKSGIYEVLILGILGTFWVNIFRMMTTVVLAVHARPIFRIVFHDYLAAVVSIVWLFFFWWFSYRYLLEPAVEDKV